ncbi:MAG: leucyl aminopeptidase [Patescibacteria group bacterium]
MKITLNKGSYDSAPKEYVRTVLTDDAKDHQKFLKENGIETLLLGTGLPAGKAGKSEEMNLRQFRLLCRRIVNVAKKNKIKKIAIQFDRTPSLFKNLHGISPEKISEVAAESFLMAGYEHISFKTKPKEGWGGVEELRAYSHVGRTTSNIEAGVRRGQEIGRAVNACRELANTPAGHMTPSVLAAAAKKAVKGLPVKVTVLGEAQMKKLGMGAILGVAKGSSEKPTFTIMSYSPSTGSTSSPQAKARGNKNNGRPIVLIGKGVTFDSGGLNLKPSSSIYEMHLDMSGAAAVIHAVALAARLKVKRSVIGIFPAVENMPGNEAYRPGDVLTSLSGKTIEVLDTDAEGRLILADAITYAKRFKPAVVVDVATLTGAALGALGQHANAFLTRDEKLAKQVEESAERSGDYSWRLPLWDEYEERVRGTFADLKNVPGGSTSRYGGAIDGAMFLWQFAKELECPWAHIDMAPRMTSVKGDELAEGACGEPVRLLFDLIENYAVHD